MGTSSVTSHGDINDIKALPTLEAETRPLTVEDKDVNPSRPLITKEKKWNKPKLIMKLRKKNKTYPINEDTPTVGGASISTGSWMARGEEPLKNTPSQEEGAGLASSSQNGMEAGHLPLVISELIDYMITYARTYIMYMYMYCVNKIIIIIKRKKLTIKIFIKIYLSVHSVLLINFTI